jgi:hypothetical protein
MILPPCREPERTQYVAALHEGMCPFCDRGPFRMVAGHVSSAHAVSRHDLREWLGLNRSHILTSPDLHEERSDLAKKNLSNPAAREGLALGLGMSAKERRRPLRLEAREGLRERLPKERTQRAIAAAKKWQHDHPKEVADNARRAGRISWTEERRAEQSRRNREASSAQSLRDWQALNPDKVREICAKAGAAGWTEERREALRQRNRRVAEERKRSQS